MKYITSALLSLTCMYNAVTAKDIIISVGAGNGTAVFNPQTVNASAGDVVHFQFTNGSHGVAQSDFATPCIPISMTNMSVNGFFSGLRPAVNPPTELLVPIDGNNNATPIFFFDLANGSCGAGGVGGINLNESSPENIAAFVRNAERLNGTQATTTTSSNSPSNTQTRPGTSPSSTNTSTNTSEASRILFPTVFSTLLITIALSLSVLY